MNTVITQPQPKRGLLQPAHNTTAFVKGGLLGFGGSGKTLTAALAALGLSKLYGTSKKVAMFDTETGSDFLIPLFKRDGIELLVVKSRAFADLLTTFREAQEQKVDALIIDSVTHVWNEIRRAYEEKLKRKGGLTFRDWGPIKQEWQGFTDAYVNAPFHAFICGRAGYEYDMVEDEENNNKKELLKTGIKMKAEGEMGYEPSLLIEMQRVARAAQITSDPDTHGWLNRALVLKDRSQQLNGQACDFTTESGKPVSYEPVIEFIKPHLAYLNIGGDHMGVDSSRNSEGLFESPDSRNERRRMVDITLELITDAFVEAGFGGTSAKAKEVQVRSLRESFGSSAWTAVSNMRLEELQEGLEKLKDVLIAAHESAEDRIATAKKFGRDTEAPLALAK